MLRAKKRKGEEQQEEDNHDRKKDKKFFFLFFSFLLIFCFFFFLFMPSSFFCSSKKSEYLLILLLNLFLKLFSTVWTRIPAFRGLFLFVISMHAITRALSKCYLFFEHECYPVSFSSALFKISFLWCWRHFRKRSNKNFVLFSKNSNKNLILWLRS